MRQHSKLLWALIAGCFGVAFFVLAYPMYVIRPFRAQGPNELTAALFVRSQASWIATAAALVAIVAMVLLWRSSRRVWPRLLALTASAVTVLAAGLTYVNVFELLFHPIDTPQAAAASEVELEDDDMVLAVRVGGHARAYPVRMMGYHHIANDQVGGVAVVATY